MNYLLGEEIGAIEEVDLLIFLLSMLKPRLKGSVCVCVCVCTEWEWVCVCVVDIGVQGNKPL